MTRLATRQVRSGKIVPYNCLKIGRICEQHMERNNLSAGENMYFAEVSLGNTRSFPSLNLHPLFCTWKTGIKNSTKTKY